MTQNTQLDDQVYGQLIAHVKQGDIEDVEKILQANLQLANRIQPLLKQPPLYYAAVHNQDEKSAEMIKLLLRYGANLKFRDHNDQTVIFYICRQGKEICAELVLTHGLSLDEVDAYGQTPIFYAISENRIQIVRKYATKERINHVDKLVGQTPIYYAARRGHLEMCKLLIEKGANITHLDNQNKSAVQYAKRAKFNQTAEYLSAELRKVKGVPKSVENVSSEEGKKQQSSLKAPKQPYKIVLYNGKGESHDLTQIQASKLLQQNPKLKQFLDNPDSITEEQLISTSQTWQKTALRIITSCSKVKGSFYFSEPVDAAKLGIVDYFDIVTNPMDLGTVKQRLLHNFYKSPQIFLQQMRLIWQNSYLYNGIEHIVSKSAKQLENAFNNLVQSTGFTKYLS